MQADTNIFYDTPATAGKQATARIPAATGTLALSKGHQKEMAEPQQQKRQQPQNLCGKALKVTGKEARDIAVNVAVIKKFDGRERSPSGRAFC
jgi:hypothetical protein